MYAAKHTKRSARRGLFLTVFVTLALSAGCGDAFDALIGKDDETPTPGPTGSPSPTGSQTPSVTPTPATATAGDITTIDWGTVALAAGQSPTFRFDVPANAIGLDFIASGAPTDRDKILLFFSVETTTPGRTLINNAGDGPARQGFNNGVMSFPIPADDNATLGISAGPWEFHVAAIGANDQFSASNPHVMVKIRTNTGGVVPNGLIDLNIIVVGGWGFNATMAQTDTELQGALAEMDALYQTIGINIGDVDYFDLPTSTAFADISSDTELEDMFARSGAVANERVNLFFVNTISGTLSGAAGIAGGIPSPQDLNGTIHSGVVITFQGNATDTGEVMAHEAGHALGMYHSTEFGGQEFDPISDTATCPTLGATGQNAGSCPDRVNVMFPQITGVFSSFTTGQGKVLRPAIHVRRNPALTFATPAPRPPKIPTGRVYNCTDGIVWSMN